MDDLLISPFSNQSKLKAVCHYYGGRYYDRNLAGSSAPTRTCRTRHKLVCYVGQKHGEVSSEELGDICRCESIDGEACGKPGGGQIGTGSRFSSSARPLMYPLLHDFLDSPRVRRLFLHSACLWGNALALLTSWTNSLNAFSVILCITFFCRSHRS
jgi:hypothetical protein